MSLSRFLISASLACLPAAGLAACGSDAKPSAETPDAATADAPASPAVNGCTAFEDRTADAASRTITWVRSVGTVCLRIKKGQSVTWNPQNTSFSDHPLQPSGGDAGNPVVAQPSGATPYVQAFADAGTFGYVCDFHPDMRGAIQVTE